MNNKVTMIGMSGSGKTCFLYAMYNFMSIPQAGFVFTAKNPDDDIDLGDGWDMITIDKIWPNGTTETSNYEFYVQYAGTKIADFSWFDYRGGALKEKSTNSDKEEILNVIKSSSCLIISIGADTMQKIMSGDSTPIREFKSLNYFINLFSAETDSRVPVIFSLTKADLYREGELKEAVKLTRMYFGSVFEENSNWSVAIVPVTLGTGISQGKSGDNIKGQISPKNINIPVLFFVKSVLEDKISSLNSRLSDINKNRFSHKQNLSLERNKSWWGKFWYGDNSGNLEKNINELNNEEKNIVKKLPEIENTISKLSEQFKGVCKIFYSGNEMN